MWTETMWTTSTNPNTNYPIYTFSTKHMSAKIELIDPNPETGQENEKDYLIEINNPCYKNHSIRFLSSSPSHVKAVATSLLFDDLDKMKDDAEMCITELSELYKKHLNGGDN